MTAGAAVDGPVAAGVADRQETAVRCAVLCGIVLAVVGVILGIVVAAHVRVVACPNGHYFPEGTTDFRCFSHPDAGLGASVAILAALLGIVVGLLGVLVSATSPGRRPAPGAPTADAGPPSGLSGA